MSASSAIARLRELRAKATAGEWCQKHHPESDLADAIVTEKDERGYWSFIARTHSAYGRAHVLKSQWEANAAAIVAAMNSLDALLECAEALAAHVAAEDEALAEWPLLSVHPWTGDEPAMKRLAKARAALDALGKVVARD